MSRTVKRLSSMDSLLFSVKLNLSDSKECECALFDPKVTIVSDCVFLETCIKSPNTSSVTYDLLLLQSSTRQTDWECYGASILNTTTCAVCRNISRSEFSHSEVDWLSLDINARASALNQDCCWTKCSLGCSLENCAQEVYLPACESGSGFSGTTRTDTNIMPARTHCV